MPQKAVETGLNSIVSYGKKGLKVRRLTVPPTTPPYPGVRGGVTGRVKENLSSPSAALSAVSASCTITVVGGARL